MSLGSMWQAVVQKRVSVLLMGRVECVCMCERVCRRFQLCTAQEPGQFIFTAVPIWPTLWPVGAASVPRLQVCAEPEPEPEPEPAPGRSIIYQRLAVVVANEESKPHARSFVLHTFRLKIKFKPFNARRTLFPATRFYGFMAKNDVMNKCVYK